MAQGAALWKGTSRKQLQTASKAQRKQRGRRSHPCLLPGLSVTPKASPALHLNQEGPQTCSQEWASRGMASKGARTAEGQGVLGCAEEAGAKRVSPGVNPACTRQPHPGSGLCRLLLTPSERGSSPLLWPEEYRLTYSPSPASSLAFSL